ncbi:protein NO VEIN domain-containing protein [Geodermatophilus sp. SYSU D01186]
MAPPLVTEDTLGAWLLRCNPEVWDLPAFMHDGNASIGQWTVVNNYRSRMMAPGQRVVLWATGDGKRIARGIWGLGWVTGPAHDHVPDDLAEDDASYWLDEAANAGAENVVAVDIPLLDAAITDAELKAAGIADLEVQVQSQGSNPSWISKEQLARVESLLPEWPERGEPDRELTVSPRGAGFGNAVQNKVVELAAMDAVRQVYEDEGWHVDDVSLAKCGWDLTCTRGAEITRAEVKGVSGDKPLVLLTANEWNAAKNQPGWVLAVATRAISAPEISVYTSQEALQAAEPYVYRADLSQS